MSRLDVRNLAVTYGHGPYLERINLKAVEGEICAIVGASGSGKSIFCEILTSRTLASAGTILFNGKPLPKEPDRSRILLRPSDAGFAHLNVRDNVQIAYDFQNPFGLRRLLGSTRQSANIKMMLERANLTQSARLFPADLTPLQRSALSILQAWVARPQLIVLDDIFAPHNTVDREWLYRLFTAFRMDVNPTVFFVTRDIAEAFKLAGRVLVFDRPQDAGLQSRSGATITYDLRLDREHRRRLALSAAAATIPAITMPANDV